ncbi:sure-like protein [Acaromyces ingoldii]|uniref:Sure-like protein n=1 Tax=Acaromyces ingoldii TaxID=215250 RepID=A0A316YZ30_9BASI|nr:sure-like protein [Acaromyces ingoldii]PWN93085.1 sure-like protein [Acaromyces ingoldii]
MARRPPRVLLVNDDGPPAPSSPHILGLYTHLRARLGWDVSVVLPSSQKSWGSMAFAIAHPVSLWYYYPLANNDRGADARTAGSWSATRRPVRPDEGEVAEWVLLDGSPTTCANIGLWSYASLYHGGGGEEGPSTSSSSSSAPSAPAFDLVISGPNFGRNTGTAFALGSGTVGAAMAAALSGVRAISLSYGHFAQPTEQMKAAAAREEKAGVGVGVGVGVGPAAGDKKEEAQQEQEKKQEQGGAGEATKRRRKASYTAPSAPREVVQLAHDLSVRIIERLWREWDDNVGVYAVNVPLCWMLRDEKVYWTTMWKSKYGQLFQPTAGAPAAAAVAAATTSATSDITATPASHQPVPASAPTPAVQFRFSPNMASMLAPKDLTVGTDTWAILNGYVSITRLRPNFSELDPSTAPGQGEAQGEGKQFRL